MNGFKPRSFLDRLTPTEFHKLGSHSPAFFGAAQTGFSPLDISGLKVWLDASDASTITKDGGDAVSVWNDKTTEANDFAQATGSDQPLWVDSVLNSLPVIRFDGTSDFMQRTTWTGGAMTQQVMMFWVAKYDQGSISGYLFDGGGASNRVFSYGGGVDDIHYFAGIGRDTGAAKGTTHRLYTFLFNGASSNFRINKSSVDTGDTGTDSCNGMTLARRHTATAWGEVDIAEFLVYDATISDTDRDAVEDYLTDKWGL